MHHSCTRETLRATTVDEVDTHHRIHRGSSLGRYSGPLCKSELYSGPSPIRSDFNLDDAWVLYATAICTCSLTSAHHRGTVCRDSEQGCRCRWKFPLWRNWKRVWKQRWWKRVRHRGHLLNSPHAVHDSLAHAVFGVIFNLNTGIFSTFTLNSSAIERSPGVDFKDVFIQDHNPLTKIAGPLSCHLFWSLFSCPHAVQRSGETTTIVKLWFLLCYCLRGKCW